MTALPPQDAPRHARPRTEMLDYFPPGAASALDVGCGDGSFGVLLREARADLVLWAVEPNAGAAGAARSSGAYDVVLDGEFLRVQIDRRFECIFFNDVLEHMVEPGHALVLASALLDPGGVIVASIPNVRCIGVLKPLLLHGDWRYEDAGLLDRTHLRFFTKKSMLRLFRDHGLEVLSVEGIHRREVAGMRLARWPIGPLLDDFLFQQYVLVARPVRPEASS